MKKSNTKFLPLLIALVLLSSLVLVACSGGEHRHVYDSWKQTTAPTCTHAGEETRTCLTDSTHTQTRPVPAHGHSYGDWVVVVQPTADAAGLQRAYCIYDDTHYIEEEIAPLSSGGSQPVPPAPAIPADGQGVLVIGGYERYVSEQKIYALVKDFEAYCNENSISRAFIGWRMYTEEAVADFSAAVRADNDVDILLGVGNNINSAGNLDNGFITEKSDAVTIYNGGASTDASRRHARTNDDELTLAFWTYIFLPRAVEILTSTSI